MGVGFIQIKAIPNQIFPVFVGDKSLDIQIKTMRDKTFMSVISNDVPIFSNIQCFTSQYVLPYEENGVNLNFIWVSPYDTPYYTRFGEEDQLLCATWEDA